LSPRWADKHDDCVKYITDTDVLRLHAERKIFIVYRRRRRRVINIIPRRLIVVYRYAYYMLMNRYVASCRLTNIIVIYIYIYFVVIILYTSRGDLAVRGGWPDVTVGRGFPPARTRNKRNTYAYKCINHGPVQYLVWNVTKTWPTRYRDCSLLTATSSDVHTYVYRRSVCGCYCVRRVRRKVLLGCCGPRPRTGAVRRSRRNVSKLRNIFSVTI